MIPTAAVSTSTGAPSTSITAPLPTIMSDRQWRRAAGSMSPRARSCSVSTICCPSTATGDYSSDITGDRLALQQHVRPDQWHAVRLDGNHRRIGPRSAPTPGSTGCQNNGGPTQTIALQAMSPAIGAGANPGESVRRSARLRRTSRTDLRYRRLPNHGCRRYHPTHRDLAGD